MSDQDKTDPGFEITPAMSKHTKDKAAAEALEHAQKVVDEINEMTESEINETYIEGYESSPGTMPTKE